MISANLLLRSAIRDKALRGADQTIYHEQQVVYLHQHSLSGERIDTMPSIFRNRHVCIDRRSQRMHARVIVCDQAQVPVTPSSLIPSLISTRIPTNTVYRKLFKLLYLSDCPEDQGDIEVHCNLTPVIFNEPHAESQLHCRLIRFDGMVS
jgi:hypothetical protein